MVTMQNQVKQGSSVLLCSFFVFGYNGHPLIPPLRPLPPSSPVTTHPPPPFYSPYVMHFPAFLLLLTLFSASEAIDHHVKRKLCDAPSARPGSGGSLSPVNTISRIMLFQVLRAQTCMPSSRWAEVWPRGPHLRVPRTLCPFQTPRSDLPGTSGSHTIRSCPQGPTPCYLWRPSMRKGLGT
jgi:hypothetical protein